MTLNTKRNERETLFKKTLQLSGEHLSGFYRIPKEVARAMLSVDGLGFPIKKNSSGRHRTTPLEGNLDKQEFSIHFKVDLHDMHEKDSDPHEGLHVGKEYAVYSLYKLLGIDTTPSSLLTIKGLKVRHLIKKVDPRDRELFEKERKKYTEKKEDTKAILIRYPRFKNLIETNKYDYAVQASLTIKGSDLDSHLAPSSAALLDPQSLSAQFIGGLLASFGDAKGDNFKVTSESSSLAQIIGIDNEDAFVFPIQKKFDPDANVLHLLKLKNIFYCHNKWLGSYVNLKERERFLKAPASVLLLMWLHGLKEQNDRYAYLHEKDAITYETMRRSGLPVTFRKGTLPSLYDRLLKLQEALFDSVTLTHQSLLQRIDPLAAAYYQAALRRAATQREAKLHNIKEGIASCYQALKDPLRTSEHESIRAQLHEHKDELQKLKSKFLAREVLEEILYKQVPFENLMDIDQPLNPGEELTIREALEEASFLESAQYFLRKIAYDSLSAPLKHIKEAIKKNQDNKEILSNIDELLSPLKIALEQVNLTQALEEASKENKILSYKTLQEIKNIAEMVHWDSLYEKVAQGIKSNIEKQEDSRYLEEDVESSIESYLQSLVYPDYSITQAIEELLSSIHWQTERSSHIKSLLEFAHQNFPQELAHALKKSNLQEIVHKAIQEDTSADVLRGGTYNSDRKLSYSL